MDPTQDRSEIAFFDLETTFPTDHGQCSILEFGAILVCPKKFEELRSYSTLVRPADPSLISTLSARRNGITPDAVATAPTFADIADTVFEILHGPYKVLIFSFNFYNTICSSELRFLFICCCLYREDTGGS